MEEEINMNIMLINKNSLIVENVILIKDLQLANKYFGSNYICIEKIQDVEIGYLYNQENNSFSKIEQQE